MEIEPQEYELVNITFLVAIVHVEIVVIVWFGNAELLLRILVHTAAQLVENVKVALVWVLCHHARLFQQKVRYLSSYWLPAHEENLHVLALS